MGPFPWETVLHELLQRPVRSLLQHRLPTGSQPPSGIHLLQHGVLHGLQVDICSTVDLHGLQGDSLPHHGLHHRLQGNLCSSAWSTSCPSFFTALGVCRVVSLTYSHSSLWLQLRSKFFPLLKYVIPEVLSISLMGSALASEQCCEYSWQHELTETVYTALQQPLGSHSSNISDQAEQCQFSQPFLIGEMLQSLHHLRGPSLVQTGKNMSISLLYWGAQSWTQCSRCGLTSAEKRGRINSLNLLETLFLTQLRIPLAFLATRAHCWLTVNLLSTRTPRSFSVKLLFSWVAPSIYGCMDFTILLVELHEVPFGPFLQPVEVPPDGSMTLWLISHSFQFCVVSKIAKGTLCPIILIINEAVKQDWTQY
ncbi:hypothetical protein QYF61_009968 [Mycteria americana]|uniref:Uncharacterized protein n=1 Tax=Mycteria americana TaxID=33587 RepID=A0AAN7MY06_MYCAM|nr:hypothetical protein QYF61_009968 [Mycteria americana]